MPGSRQKPGEAFRRFFTTEHTTLKIGRLIFE